MNINPIEALQASGLNPIVIDEHTDFSKLNLQRPKTESEMVEETLMAMFHLIVRLNDYAKEATLEGDALPSCCAEADSMIASYMSFAADEAARQQGA